MVLTMHGGYNPKKALIPGSKNECTCARMMVKSPDIQFGIWFSTWNVGSISEKWGEISETLKRSCVDICCLQEVRWKGPGVKIVGNGFKFLWRGDCKGEKSVGAIVENWLIGKVVGVERFHDRVIKVSIVFGNAVWKVVTCYSP